MGAEQGQLLSSLDTTTQRSPALTQWPLGLHSSSTQQELLVASVTSHQATVSLG